MQVHAQDSVRTRRPVKEVRADFKLPSKVQRKTERIFEGKKDSLGIAKAAREAEAYLAGEGYIEAAVDSFRQVGKVLHLSIHTGPRYLLDSIGLYGLGELEYQKAGYQKLVQKKVPFDPDEFQQRLASNLDAYQNQGYPFARFDSLRTGWRKSGENLLGTISYRFQPGRLVTIDSVLVEGDVREKEAFIQGMIGIYPGDVFDQGAIDQASKILSNSIYFKNVKAAKVEFVDEQTAKIKLKVEPRKAGKFDLLLGILPPRDESARLEFTGLADFQLVSPLFRSGELLTFRFDKLVGSSQKLHLSYTQPYLFGSPMQVQGEFDLLKQDTTFLTRYLRLSTAYAFSPQLSVRVYYKNKTSSLIATKQYDSLRPPPVLDGKDQTYGIGFQFQNLDYRFNPRRGWDISLDFGVGRKRIVDNPTLDDRIYSGLTLRLPKREADFQIRWFRNYTKRLVLMLGGRTYWLDQEQYFQNDLLQTGGSRTIRGFDENQFFANLLVQGTIENRFLLEENSYIFVFSDYAYLENRSENGSTLRPWGMGLGLTYETRAGMVSVTYATGRVAEFPFQPSRGRIHVGLVNQF